MRRYEGFEQWLPRRPPAGGELRQSESLVFAQWLHVLYDSPVMFSGLLDRDGRLLAANELSVEGCGFERTDVIGRRFWECGWWAPEPALATKVCDWCTTAAETASSLSAICRYHRGDGSTGMVEFGLVPIVDDTEGGPDVTHLVVTGLDITALLAAQAQREDLLVAETAQSREAEQRFRDALHAMIDAVTIARSVRDAHGAIVDFEVEFLNEAGAASTVRSGDEIIGGRVCDLYPSWRSSGQFDRFVKVVETGEPLVVDRLPYDDLLPDGRTVSGYWDLQVSKLDDGYIAASRDVTAIVEVERAAAQAAQLALREQVALEILQRAALEVDLPRLDGTRLGVHYQAAASEVPLGGDWYDVVHVGDDVLVLLIADVAGHGPQSASYMVQLRNILRTVAVEQPEPAELLSRANRVVHRLQSADAPFATCCAAMLRTSTGELQWSLAGHPPALVHAVDGTTRYLTSKPGLPLGYLPDASYVSASTTVHPGDRVVFYTDGLIETRTSSLDAGMERLRDGVRAARRLAAQEAAEWVGQQVASGTDDVALIVLDLVAPAGPDAT